MFHFLSWGHVLVLALGALFIFGPGRLPTVARDAARGLRRARVVSDELRAQVGEELGGDLAPLRDLDLRRYHPRTFLRDQLLGEDPPGAGADPPAIPTGSTWSSAAASRAPERAPIRRLAPPIDHDAT